jgi:heterotetrameric sarcosine oxidase gamma subunit
VAESPGVTLREITGLGVTALHGRPDPLPGLPQGPGSASLPQGTAIWTAPGQWLLLHAPGARLPVAEGHRTDLTGARRILEIAGPRAREALATLLPIDLHPAAFGDQAAAATIAAHIPVLVWRDGEAFRIACYRSYGESLREALLVAGRGRDR